jgi:ABC transporter with metal-binding/Fe-S-binding domain ATP-binding protein
MIPQRDDSWMFHYPNIRLTTLFAKATGIRLAKAETSGIKEQETEDLKNLLKTLDVDGIVAGVIASQYQKQRLQELSEELGLKLLTPLWMENQTDLLRELVASGFETIITGVYAQGFDEKWLGRSIDISAICDLIELNRKYQISPVGEGGEYETLVLNAPFFERKIELVETEKIWEGQSGWLLIREARLAKRT